MGEKNVAIILAAGQGKRMNSSVQKQYLLIQNKPVLYYSLEVFEKSFIDEIVLVVGVGEKEYCQHEIVQKYGFKKVCHIVEGGQERYHSVFHGLQVIDDCDYVFIHDGARPFVSSVMLNRTLKEVRSKKACVAGMPVKDTIKIADANGFVKETPRRDRLWMVQTPQVFSFPLIRTAYRKLMEQEMELIENGVQITDDAMVAETFMDVKVALVEGSYQNIKITTPEDLGVAELFLTER